MKDLLRYMNVTPTKFLSEAAVVVWCVLLAGGGGKVGWNGRCWKLRSLLQKMNRLSKTWQSLKSYPNRSVEVQSFFSLKSFGHHISTDMEKSHPNRNQTIPNWIEINPPKSTHKKATNHTPKLKPHFNSIHFQPPYFLSGRLGGPHG